MKRLGMGILLFAAMTLGPAVGIKAQQYCPGTVHFSSTQSGGQKSACLNPFVIQQSDGGGDVTVCIQITDGSNLITVNDMCSGEVKQYTDIETTHLPGVNDINPYYSYSYNQNTQTATIYGHFTVVHFKFGSIYTWWYDHGFAFVTL